MLKVSLFEEAQVKSLPQMGRILGEKASKHISDLTHKALICSL